MATVIVSDDSIQNLIEAHASMAAWYYQLADALRAAGGTVSPPSDAQRLAYVAQLAQHFPELREVAKRITNPRPYVPPPAIPVPTHVVENDGVSVSEPPAGHIAAPAMVPTSEPPPPPAAPAPPMASDPSEGSAPPLSSAAPPPPPPIVDPSKVRYQDED